VHRRWKGRIDLGGAEPEDRGDFIGHLTTSNRRLTITIERVRRFTITDVSRMKSSVGPDELQDDSNREADLEPPPAQPHQTQFRTKKENQ
jgi:hypothetical protein